MLSVSVYIELFLCFKENYKRRILCGLIHVLELSNSLSNKKSLWCPGNFSKRVCGSFSFSKKCRWILTSLEYFHNENKDAHTLLLKTGNCNNSWRLEHNSWSAWNEKNNLFASLPRTFEYEVANFIRIKCCLRNSLTKILRSIATVTSWIHCSS